MSHIEEYKKLSHNEISRVQIPAMIHLTRLGYEYFGNINKSDANKVFDPNNNILIEVFREQFYFLNKGNEHKFKEIYREIKKRLENPDLGKSFYEYLIKNDSTKIIDFENWKNNKFHFTKEFTCEKDGESFRPDITLFINGLPLVLVEVKKPNNDGGILEEKTRMEKRFKNPKFKSFINLTQLYIFSNNMEYDDKSQLHYYQGSFYCTSSKDEAFFNYFREENKNSNYTPEYISRFPYKNIENETELRILADFNMHIIISSPEYKTNKEITTPTNQILTSMCSPERLLFLIKYGVAYVNSEREIYGKMEVINQKHIMRYQQFFASIALIKSLEQGNKKGIIWHTQGSGKTALSFYFSKILKDYYSKRNKVTKIYFIVDRIDLATQASNEFSSRGLQVVIPMNKKELNKQFKESNANEKISGKEEIVVINIHKFEEKEENLEQITQSSDLQRIFIVDEAHRGYKPTGSFLANLFESDPNAIKIALTGTPLLKKDSASKKVFGNYIHTYYYDKSIQDGYTLKIMREDIETKYKKSLIDIYLNLEIITEKRKVKKTQIIENYQYLEQLWKYIIQDFNNFRKYQEEPTLGAMIVCQTNEQAKKLYKLFEKEPNNSLKVGLVLYDSGTKEENNQIIKGFKKENTIDILIVNNMLLTGFDSGRLKRLYLCRKLDGHTLLQAITRVNRPYKKSKYGYIVDFANIKQNFETTNQMYLNELRNINEENNNFDFYENIFENEDYIKEEVSNIYDLLSKYDQNNLEIFKLQLNKSTKNEAIKIRNALERFKDIRNFARHTSNKQIIKWINNFDIYRKNEMLSEVKNHINFINFKESSKNAENSEIIVKQILENIVFSFSIKSKNRELKILDYNNNFDILQEVINENKELIKNNMDQKDPEFISIEEEFYRIFNKLGWNLEVNDNKIEFENYEKYLDALENMKLIKQKLIIKERQNKKISEKYKNDEKFARIQRRIQEMYYNEKGKNKIENLYGEKVLTFLLKIKKQIDEIVQNKNDVLNKLHWLKRMILKIISTESGELEIKLSKEQKELISNEIIKEYMQQYR